MGDDNSEESSISAPFLVAGGDPNWKEDESSYVPCSICQAQCFVGMPHPRIAICSDFCRASLLRKQDEIKALNPERAKRGRSLKVIQSLILLPQSPDESGIVLKGR